MVDKSGGGVVNATTFSFNPNLSELCADIVFSYVCQQHMFVTNKWKKWEQICDKVALR